MEFQDASCSNKVISRSVQGEFCPTLDHSDPFIFSLTNQLRLICSISASFSWWMAPSLKYRDTCLFSSKKDFVNTMRKETYATYKLYCRCGIFRVRCRDISPPNMTYYCQNVIFLFHLTIPHSSINLQAYSIKL